MLLRRSDAEARISGGSQSELRVVPTQFEPSIIRGGPFYRIQQLTRLIRPDQWNLCRRVAVAVILGWLPLVLLTIFFNPHGLGSLLRDYRVASRILIAVPILLLGQPFMDSRFRLAVRHVSAAGLLNASDVARMRDAVDRLVRLRDAALPELAILLLLIARTATAEKRQVDATPWLAHGTGDATLLTPAGWYAVVVSAPLFEFLLGLGVWKWLLWTFFAYKLSRLNLKLIPTHPDGHGGLGFLGLTPAAFTPVIFAATCAIGSTWRHEILAGRANLTTFKIPGIILLIIFALFALGPLAFFVPRLAALRRQGILEYGILGQMHSADFHNKWILSRAGHEAEFLTAPESSTLYTFGQTYQTIKGLKPLPTDPGALWALTISVALPMLPVILAVIPLKIVLETLLKALH